MVPPPPIRSRRLVAAETAHASPRLIVIVSAVGVCVLASAALPGASLGAGSAAVVLDMDPGAPGIQNTRSYPAGTTDIYVDVWVVNADAGGRGARQVPFVGSRQPAPRRDITIDNCALRSSMMAVHSAIRAFSASLTGARGQDRTPVEAGCAQVPAVVVSHKVPGERRLRMRGRALLSWRRCAPKLC